MQIFAAEKIVIRAEKPGDREAILALRPAIFGPELHASEEIVGAFDDVCRYYVAMRGSRCIGFSCVVPPTAPKFGIDNYVKREQYSFHITDRTCELRLLAVDRDFRKGGLAYLLLFAAVGTLLAEGVEMLVCSSRGWTSDLYVSLGMRKTGLFFQPGGGVTMEVLYGYLQDFVPIVNRLKSNIEKIIPLLDDVLWEMPFPLRELIPETVS